MVLTSLRIYLRFRLARSVTRTPTYAPNLTPVNGQERPVYANAQETKLHFSYTMVNGSVLIIVTSERLKVSFINLSVE